jgi:signal peptidase I
LRNARIHAKHVLFHARHVRNMREDILKESDLVSLAAAEQAVMSEVKGGTPEGIISRSNTLADLSTKLAPDLGSSFRENFEIIIVAIAVAMAFRAFFFQPFKIPTGSMQPTLYGVHSSAAYSKPGILDIMPLKIFNWLVTGNWYREVRITESGHLASLKDGGMDNPSDNVYEVAGRKYLVPKDASITNKWGDYLEKGDLLWSGVVTSGDHVFVNKFKWFLRPPKRGDVMVFKTTGIYSLPIGIYYIKRMAGLPGETLSIKSPDLIINGQCVTEPNSIARIARREGSYEGYQPAWNDPSAVIRTADDSFKLGDAQYFALGDHTGNSRDSRYWGAVPRENLVGSGAMVYWLFSVRWGLMD